MSGGEKSARPLIFLFGGVALDTIAWILVYAIQNIHELTPTLEIIGIAAYFCSVLPFGPGLLFLVAICLFLMRR